MKSFGLVCVTLWSVFCTPSAAIPTGSYSITAEESIDRSDGAELVVNIVDDRSTKTAPILLPARVIITASDGSHPDGSGHGVYDDGRFFIEGTFSVSTVPGNTKINLTRGPNYVPLEFSIEAKAGKRLLVEVRLHRWFSIEDHGWYGGDNHVHAQHDDTASVKSGLDYTALQGRANGLSFITEAGSNVSYDGLSQISTPAFLLRYAGEIRPGCYAGHVNTPGITQPLSRDVLDAAMKAPLPVLSVTRAVHDLGGITIHTHPLMPPHQLHWMGAAELFSDAVLGQCTDLVDVDSKLTELLWFSVLNLGNKTGCSGSTDSALGRLHTLSPGDRRVYCRANSLTYPAMVDAMREGRTFATNGGPLFPLFTIDSNEPGAVLSTEQGKNHEARLEIHALYPIVSAILYRNGNPEKTFDLDGQSGKNVLNYAFAEREKAWYVARVQDNQGNWAITSPVYFEVQNPPKDVPKAAVLLEINNCTRFAQLRRDFFAHFMVTVSPDDRLVSIELRRNGQTTRRFTVDEGNQLTSGKTPVTEMFGEYGPGWIWHPTVEKAVHFQADWPVTETGWYAVHATTAQGRQLHSDAVYYDRANPNSHELSVARMTGPDTEFSLWGYGAEMPITNIQLPFEGDHWWYPGSTYYRIKASFAEQDYVHSGGNKEVEALFKMATP
jgi:hypothetical protein